MCCVWHKKQEKPLMVYLLDMYWVIIKPYTKHFSYGRELFLSNISLCSSTLYKKAISIRLWHTEKKILKKISNSKKWSKVKQILMNSLLFSNKLTWNNSHLCLDEKKIFYPRKSVKFPKRCHAMPKYLTYVRF